jgi:hypothetical protein
MYVCNKGKPKTPDILFLVPMGVYDMSDKLDKGQENRPYVINWIDSKVDFYCVFFIYLYIFCLILIELFNLSRTV